MDPRRLESFLADEVFASSVVPVPCPSVFGQADRYELVDMIAQGPRSWVYKAHDRRFGEAAEVAIKMYRPGTRSSEGLLGRQVRHSNVISILDQGVDPATGFEYVVTDFASNGTLADVRVPMQLKDAVQIVMDLARAVNTAHQAGIVHCDIKPQNVLVDHHGVFKLADFELATNVRNGRASAASGTPAFMAPEQWRKEEFSATPAADIYALGGVLYWLLTASYPNGGTQAEAEAFAAGKVVRSAPRVPVPIRRIMEKALAPNPEERFASAEDLARDLGHWACNEPIEWMEPGPVTRALLWTRRFPWRTAVAIALAVTSIVTIAAWFQIHNARLAADVRAQVLAEQEAGRRFAKKTDEVRSGLDKAYADVLNLLYDEGMTAEGQNALLGGLVEESHLMEVVHRKEIEEVSNRVNVLTQSLDQAILAGTDHRHYFLNLRVCLAADLLMLDRDDEVKRHTRVVNDALAPLLAPDDPLRTACDMLQRAADYHAGDTVASQAIKALDLQLRPTGAYPNVRRAIWYRLRNPPGSLP